MNLQPYRQSFYVYVASSDVEKGRQISNQLTLAGYSCEQRLTSQSLFDELIKSPPHIIVFFYNDAHFFENEKQYKEVLESIQKRLPEVHIIFLAEEKSVAKACELYEFDIYDVLAWPFTHPMQLLKAVDRAAETDYYLYLNEQLREKVDNKPTAIDADFAMFEVLQKEIESCESREDLIQLWLKEAARVHQSPRALFLRYVDSKKMLVASVAVGLRTDDIQGVGLDLLKQEPGFDTQLLKNPERMQSLSDFTLRGLQADQAAYYTLIHEDVILGVVVVPIPKENRVNEANLKNSYLLATQHLLQKHMQFLDIKARLKKFSIYDEVSEALTAEIMMQKVTEEVSRARRLSRPVSLLLLAIDGLVDLSLAQSKENIHNLLRNLSDLLKKHSRLNDLVGRVAPDQFAICLPHTDKRGAAIKAERFRRMIESADFSQILGATQKMTVSIGVAEYPAVCHDVDGLFQSAESALLEIRKVGLNKVLIALPPARFVPDFTVNNDKRTAPVTPYSRPG